jgi:hypothetical protein
VFSATGEVQIAVNSLARTILIHHLAVVEPALQPTFSGTANLKIFTIFQVVAMSEGLSLI